MGWEGWVTAFVLLIVLSLLVRERMSARVAVLGSVVALVLLGVLSPTQAFSGFSSEAPITIAALFIVSAATQATGALDSFVAASLGKASATEHRAGRLELLRMIVPATALSSFVYNTPATSLLAPQVASWARRAKRPPSWYLLPLNYAILFGGLITAVGTTTNAVISGLLVAKHEKSLGIFELAPYGLVLAAVGVVAMIVLAPHLMPDLRTTEDELDDIRDFTLSRTVESGGPLVGLTVAEAGLRSLEGTFLIHLSREGDFVAPVAPQEVLRSGDQLTFVGNLQRAVDLHSMPGLVAADETPGMEGGRFYEAVLGQGSGMVGRTPKELGFRALFDSAIVAVHRDGERLPGKLGDVKLRGGDLLLLLSGPDPALLERSRGDFLVIAPVVDVPASIKPGHKRWVQLVLVAFLAVTSSGMVDVVHASLGAAALIVTLRVLSPAEAAAAIDLNVLVTLCASFGLGAAVGSSGLASSLAGMLVSALSWMGGAGVLLGVLLATAALTQVVTNNAAAIVMFPVALAAAEQSGEPVRPFVLAVASAASLSFLTSFGYQTNLIVAGLAHYRARDFLPLGTVLLALSLGLLALMLSAQLHP